MKSRPPATPAPNWAIGGSCRPIQRPSAPSSKNVISQLLGAFVPVDFSDESAHNEGEARAVKTAKLMAQAAGSQPFLVLADENGKDPSRTANAGRIEHKHSLSPKQVGNLRSRESTGSRLRSSGRPGCARVFHHHCAGFVETPWEIEALLKVTDPELLGLCFDTGHYKFGGGTDPVAALRQFRDRIWYVHYKDCSPQRRAEAKGKSWNYFEALKHGIFCELGKGDVDFPAVTAELRKTNYNGWIVVEQDVLPGMGEPKEFARRNREYLERPADFRITQNFYGFTNLSIGVIGAGRIGKIHAENIARQLPGAHLAGVADVNSRPRRNWRSTRIAGRNCGEYPELLHGPGLQAVAICSATNTHADIIEAAAAAHGKHIFCEKPIDLDLNAFSRRSRRSRKPGVKFQVGFNRRFDPSFAKVREVSPPGRSARCTSCGSPAVIRRRRPFLCQSVGRHIPGYDHSRFRHGPVPERERSGRSLCDGRSLVDPEIGRAGDMDTCIISLRLAERRARHNR